MEPGFVAELAVAAALKAGGVEGVDVAEAVGPGHLEAVEADEVLIGDFLRCGVALGPFGTDPCQIGPQIHAGITLIVEGVGVVGDRQEVQVLHLGGMLESFCHAARPVGDVGVGVELAEVELVAVQGHRGLIGEGTHFADLLFVPSLAGRTAMALMTSGEPLVGAGTCPWPSPRVMASVYMVLLVVGSLPLGGC